jgi:RHS repeat-associated protein
MKRLASIEVADTPSAADVAIWRGAACPELVERDGETVQTYEYSVYGEPAASDPNHPNPFLFTARRFDRETGLYHYRARAYNPYIGRFLQTDPAGQGMNAYAYCGNNATNCVDSSGAWASYVFKWREDEPQHVLALCYDDKERQHLGTCFYFDDYVDLMQYIAGGGDFCDVNFRDDHGDVFFVGLRGPGEAWKREIRDYVYSGTPDVCLKLSNARYTIDRAEWGAYVKRVRSEVDSYGANAYWQAAIYDTRITDNGVELFLHGKGSAEADWFFIEPLGIEVQGYELNYFGQGMLYARQGLPAATCIALPTAWKYANMIADMINPWWNPGYAPPTEYELRFVYYGYWYYKNGFRR